MRWELIFAGLAGLLSALLFGALASRSLGGVIFANLTMLPLFAAGLAVGLSGAIVAVGVGLAATLLFAGFARTVFYAAAFVLPVVVLVRQALLSRQDATGTSWYPPGLLLLWLSGLGAAMALYWMVQLSFDDTAEALRQQLMVMLQGTQDPAGQPVPTDETAARIATWLIGYLPGLLAASWMLTIVVNGALAQGLVRRIGHNRRPSPATAEIELPWPLALIFVAMVLASMLPDTIGYVGRTFAMVLGVPLFLQGLGVVHAFAGQIASPGFILAAFYLLLLISGFAVPLVVLLGLIEQWAHLRRRIGPAGPNRENE